MKNIANKTPVHKIIHGDCLEVMKKIPDNYVDFICSDFPYNISNKPGLTFRGDRIVKADFGDWDKFESRQVYLDFVFRVIDEYKRILKPRASMVLFFSYRDAGWIGGELERRGLFTFRMPIILNKKNPMPNVKKNSFRSCYEFGIRLVNDGGQFRRPKTFNFLEQAKMRSVLQYRIGRDGNKQTAHPTEKPEGIIGRLIRVFSNPNDVVLDSFGGGGTTGIAAYKLHRNCITIEQEAGFIKMMEQRQKRAERRVAANGFACT